MRVGEGVQLVGERGPWHGEDAQVALIDALARQPAQTRGILLFQLAPFLAAASSVAAQRALGAR